MGGLPTLSNQNMGVYTQTQCVHTTCWGVKTSHKYLHGGGGSSGVGRKAWCALRKFPVTHRLWTPLYTSTHPSSQTYMLRTGGAGSSTHPFPTPGAEGIGRKEPTAQDAGAEDPRVHSGVGGIRWRHGPEAHSLTLPLSQELPRPLSRPVPSSLSMLKLGSRVLTFTQPAESRAGCTCMPHG